VLWKSLGGTWIRPPHALALGPDRLALFTLGTDHIARVRWRLADDWTDYTRLSDNRMITAPRAVAHGDDQLDVFAVDHRHSIHHWSWTGDSWYEQELSGEAGGATITAPHALWSAPERLDVFVLGTNLEIWHRWREAGQWNEGWQTLGSLWLSPPRAVSRHPGTIDVVAINSGSNLQHATFAEGRWNGWRQTGEEQIAISQPDAVADGSYLDVLVLGERRLIYHYRCDEDWQPPVELDGLTVTSAPRAMAGGRGRLDVFVVGENGEVWHRARGAEREEGWHSLGGQAFSTPAIVARPGGAVELFTLGLESDIQHTVLRF
jgi:hypothetical protein